MFLNEVQPLSYQTWLCSYEAVVLSTEAQVDLTDSAEHVRPQDAPLPAAVLAGLTGGVERSVEQVQVKPHTILWGMASVSPDRLRYMDRGAEAHVRC